MVRRRRANSLALTAQDHAVLTRMLRGMSNREIAAELGVREDTVAWHVTCVFRYARGRWPGRRFRRTGDLVPFKGEMLRAYEDGAQPGAASAAGGAPGGDG